MTDLKKIVEELGIEYDVVCEVGVWKPEESHILNLIPYAKKVLMFEAQKEYAEQSRLAFKEYDYVTVHNVAIYNENLDSVQFVDIGSSSYIEGTISPSVNMHVYNIPQRDRFHVEARTFDNYDDGDIDIITIDVEGVEWYVLNKMKSRPRLICLETHYDPIGYINPFMKEIEAWLNENGYIQHIKDVSDTIYKKL